ncbi:MAG: cation transporter [Acidimicrobiia bacterium]
MSDRRVERRAVVLEWITIAWNSGEVVVTLVLGIAARSLALVAFGLDAVVEVFASVVVVWHLGRDRTESRHDRRALRLVAVAFAALAALLTVGAVLALASEHRADESPVGILYLAATAVVMFGLAFAKRRAAVGLRSQPLAAEATLTMLDGVLATSILLALAANAALGWWWADPIATLLVALVAANEARDNWDDAG